MRISSKLMVIVGLTIFEVTITLWSVLEIAKGATFHQLNYLHLKYNVEFSEELQSIHDGKRIDTQHLTEQILLIKAQPQACLNQINFVNEWVMQAIGTDQIIALCEKDVGDAQVALAVVSAFENQQISPEVLMSELNLAYVNFSENSAKFEVPTQKTVSFITKTLIPLVVIISLFNILIITLMSRNIRRSISSVISMLSRESSSNNVSEDIDRYVSGELKNLLEAARKRISKELMVTEINKKLESLVNQRTESLTRANEELSQFAYCASHDLKSPLVSTRRLTEFIAQDIKDGQIDVALDDLAKIGRQMTKLETLVVNILSLTKVDLDEEGSVPFNLCELLADINSNVQGLLEEHGVRLINEVDCLTAIVASQTRIQQIVENLITNGIKYSDRAKDERYVSVSTMHTDSHYQIKVSDNGVGIPKGKHKHVFGMFTRCHPDMSSGSGLGLAIVKRHVDNMQGEITLISSNQGTEFLVSFLKETAQGDNHE